MQKQQLFGDEPIKPKHFFTIHSMKLFSSLHYMLRMTYGKKEFDESMALIKNSLVHEGYDRTMTFKSHQRNMHYVLDNLVIKHPMIKRNFVDELRAQETHLQSRYDKKTVRYHVFSLADIAENGFANHWTLYNAFQYDPKDLTVFPEKIFMDKQELKEHVAQNSNVKPNASVPRKLLLLDDTDVRTREDIIRGLRGGIGQIPSEGIKAVMINDDLSRKHATTISIARMYPENFILNNDYQPIRWQQVGRLPHDRKIPVRGDLRTVFVTTLMEHVRWLDKELKQCAEVLNKMHGFGTEDFMSLIWKLFKLRCETEEELMTYTAELFRLEEFTSVISSTFDD